MKPPFSPDQFFGLFEQYHAAVFPSKWIILLLGIISLLLLHFPRNYANHFTGLVLAFLWIWAGSAYFLAQFVTLSKAGFLFGGLFILQGLLTGYFAFRKDRLSFSFHGLKREYAGYALILFGLFLYPVIAYCLEGSLSRTISLGLPCPTTIITFGFFMLTSSRFPRILLIIPTIWALIGMNAAIHFGVIQDYMMVIAAIGANILLLGKRTHRL